MAGYLCLMPLASSLRMASGIILLANPIFNLSSLIFHLDASGIFFANDLLASFLCWLPLSFIFNLSSLIFHL